MDNIILDGKKVKWDSKKQQLVYLNNKLVKGDRLELAGNYVDKKIQESIPAYERHKDDIYWRPLTARVVDRDLLPVKHERMLEIAWYLYDRNPIAHRIIEMTKDFVIGEGLTYEAEDKRVKEVLDEFWNDPVNLWDLKQEQKIKELGIYGEQFYPVFVNPENGHVRMGYLDPSLVWKVVPNPDNVEEIVEIKTRGAEGLGVESRTYKTINIDNDPKSETYGLWIGECFNFAINKVSNALRGRSDLLALADWIDAYERFLFNRGERAHLLNSFLWDIELQGLNNEQIDEWIRNQKIPKPGSMRAHNEKVKWQAATPKLESADASNEARLFRNHILGGAGLPPHWFAGGEGITRATALEMGTPAFKMLKSRQKYFKYMVSHIFRFVIDQKVIHGVLPKDVNKKFTINLPRLVGKDVAEMATALVSVTTSLQVATEQEWISDDTASKVYAFLLSQLGAEVSPAEKEKIKEELLKKSVEDYNQSNLKKAIDEVKESASKRT